MGSGLARRVVGHTYRTASRKSKSWQPVYVFVWLQEESRAWRLLEGVLKQSKGNPLTVPPSHPAPTEEAGSSFSGVASGSPKLLERLDRGHGAGEGAAQGLAKELDEAVLTVGLVILLLKGAFVELLEAEGTDEVLWVELLGHGCDAAAGDGLLAAGAERAAPLVVVHLAVGLPVVFEKAAIDEWREALLQEKGIGVQVGATHTNLFPLLCKNKTTLTVYPYRHPAWTTGACIPLGRVEAGSGSRGKEPCSQESPYKFLWSQKPWPGPPRQPLGMRSGKCPLVALPLNMLVSGLAGGLQ